MNFKKWLEHDHLYDDLHTKHELGKTSPEENERLNASRPFIGSTEYHPNPDYDKEMPRDYDNNHFGLPPKEYRDNHPDWEKRFYKTLHKEIAPQINLKNKRIVLSRYRHPPVVIPITNKDPMIDHHHGLKPYGGLWYAFGNDWIGFSQSVPHRLSMFIHEIKIDLNKILILKNKQETENFERDYGLKRDINSEKYEVIIDWQKVSRDYSGIEIHKEALHYIDWQEYWDLASGCIWNQDALKDSKLLYVYNIFSKKYESPRTLGVYSGKSSKIKKRLPPT